MNIIKYLPVLLGLLLVAGCGKSTGSGSRPVEKGADFPAATFDHTAPEILRVGVPDMTCRNCVAKIRNGMAGVSGVCGWDCDTLQHMVYVRLSGSRQARAADSGAVVQAIRSAGFTVTAQ